MAVLDPYRTLGLAPGATLDEVKAAYRRLAKRYHPDSAGSAAVARFLEIQHAYEMLTTGRFVSPVVRPRPARPATRPRPGSSAGPRPGAGPRPAGSASQRTRPRTGSAGPGASAGARSDRPKGDRSASDRPRSGRRKATLGSTSYDEATSGPLDPGWAGASWYGTDSGTYWTVNPREYADPRKHGPEYQERARRAVGAEPRRPETPDPPVASFGHEAPTFRPARASARPAEDVGPRFPGILALGVALFGLGIALMTILALFARP